MNTYTVHELKTDPLPFEALRTGVKTSEIRRNDREYQVGQVVKLKETVYSSTEMTMQGAELQYTGRVLCRFITHVQDGYGLTAGHVCLSLSKQPPA